MSTALLHYIDPGLPPVGVWWLPAHQTHPESFYRDDASYTDGATAVLGEDYDGSPFSLARWQYVTDRLPGLHSPFSTWLAVQYDGDPRSLLNIPQAQLQEVPPAS